MLVADDRGFAFVTDRAFAKDSAIQLVPWAKIQGVVRSGNDPLPGARVSVNVGSPAEGMHSAARATADAASKAGEVSVPLPRFHYSVETDDRGMFHVDRIPPGTVRLSLLVQVSANRFVGLREKTLEVAPGEVHEVNLGGGGRRVVGRVDLPRHAGPYGNAMEPCSARFGGVAFDRTVEPQPSLRNAMRLRGLPKRFYPFGVQEDGTFTIHDVAPGDYRLVLELSCGSYAASPSHIVDFNCEVPVGDLDVPFDLGELKAAEIQQP